MRLTLGFVLMCFCGRAAAIRPVDTSVSSLDDQGDPMWLDRADHHGVIEALKDIHDAEAASRSGTAHIIQGEEAGYELDVESADDKVDTAKIRYKAAREESSGANRRAAVEGMTEDRVSNELLEAQTIRAADDSYNGETEHGEHRIEHDTSRMNQVKKELIDAQGRGQTADKMARHYTLTEHEARKKLEDARVDREITESLLAGTENDDREAKQAVKEAKEDAEDAAVYQDHSGSQVVGFGDDPSAEYIVEGKHMYRARLSQTQAREQREQREQVDLSPTLEGVLQKQEQPVSPVILAQNAASLVQDALDAENAMEHRDVSWAMATGAAHGFGPKLPAEPMLGEAGAPVFRISAGSSLAAVTEVNHIASNMKQAAHDALTVADNEADGEMLQAVKVLATIGEATNATMKAGKAVTVGKHWGKKIEQAVVAPSGLGQSNDQAPAADAATQALIASLKQKVKAQQLQIKHLSNQSAFAAEHEASSWMEAFHKKEKKDSAFFDAHLQEATLDSVKRQDAVKKDLKWSRTKMLVQSSVEDLNEATNTDKHSTKKYGQAAANTGQVLQQLRQLATKAATERGLFEAMGPRMSDERIAGSAVSKQNDAKRTDQYHAMGKAEAQWRQLAAEVPRTIEVERAASLDMFESMKMKNSAVRDHSDSEVTETRARCEAEKSTAVTCAEMKQRLAVAFQKHSCADWMNWRAKIEKETCIYELDTLESKFKFEQTALAECQKGVCQPGMFVNATATSTRPKTNQTEMVASNQTSH